MGAHVGLYDMPIISLICGCLAFAFLIGGFLTTGIPVLGAILSFGSPILGLVGIITGGIGISRAKQMGESEGAATAGLVVSVIGFVLGLLVALTCGLCNACMSSAGIQNASQGPQGSLPFPTLPQLPPPTPSAPLNHRPLPVSATPAAGATLHTAAVAQLNEYGEQPSTEAGWRYFFQSIACPLTPTDACVLSFTVTRAGAAEQAWTELPRYALHEAPDADGYLDDLAEATESALTLWEAGVNPSVRRILGIRLPATQIPSHVQAALVDELNQICSLTCSHSHLSEYSYRFTAFECPESPQEQCSVAFAGMNRRRQEPALNGRIELPRYATTYLLSEDEPGYGEVSETFFGELDLALLRQQASR